MGLAEPRKRVKISHDPRNLFWLSSGSSDTTGGGGTSSFGKRLMQQQGWRQGQALGARPANGNGSHNNDDEQQLDAQRLAAAKVGVIIKDDTLGLGAQLRSKDVTHQKTGLDAFQGLLGRLNAKGEGAEEVEEAVRELERKAGDRKLEMYARGRWGGAVVFVRGGVLEPQREEKREQEQQEQKQERLDDKGKKETEKEKEKEGKKKKKSKEEKKMKKNKKTAQSKEEEKEEVVVAAPDELKKSSEEEEEAKEEKKTKKDKKEKEKEKKRRRSSTAAVTAVAAAAVEEAATAKKPVVQLSNGRHILRGRNIEAKRKAFSDAKGLDAIFMKTTTATAASA